MVSPSPVCVITENIAMSNDTSPPPTNHREYFRQIHPQLDSFLQLCREEYRREFDRIENIQRRATQWLTLLSAIAVALHWASPIEIFYKTSCSVIDVLYAISWVIACMTFMSGVCFMFGFIFIKKFRVIPPLTKIKERLINCIQIKEDPAAIEFLLFGFLSDEYAESQKDAIAKNEKRLIMLTCLQVSVLVSLVFLLISVCMKAIA